ncbi:MAG: exodeoxyribonuclease III [Puniceicoccales bacterium]|jgi:exodeoxyribonuclease-3|nr:exodeoxyribonuclease III [Puniceicoccales bacterium]
MRIVTWNVNGLRSAVGKTFHAMVAEIRPDVLCLQETKISCDSKLPDLGEFQCKYFHCALRRGYSGTAVLSKIKPLAYDCNTPPDRLIEPMEGRVQLLEFEKFFLVNVYVPNAQAELTRLPLRRDRWDPTFRDFLLNLSREKDVVACGDFNVAHREIDLARPKENRGNAGFSDGERSGFDNYIGAGFVDVFRALHPNRGGSYSWWSQRADARKRNVGWRIDYFLATENLLPHVTNCEILAHIGGSDHAPVAIDLLP